MWRGPLVPVPTGPAGPQNSMKTLARSTWRRPSGLPRPDSSGRFLGVSQRRVITTTNRISVCFRLAVISQQPASGKIRADTKAPGASPFRQASLRSPCEVGAFTARGRRGGIQTAAGDGETGMGVLIGREVAGEPGELHAESFGNGKSAQGAMGQ